MRQYTANDENAKCLEFYANCRNANNVSRIIIYIYAVDTAVENSVLLCGDYTAFRQVL